MIILEKTKQVEKSLKDIYADIIQAETVPDLHEVIQNAVYAQMILNRIVYRLNKMVEGDE